MHAHWKGGGAGGGGGGRGVDMLALCCTSHSLTDGYESFRERACARAATPLRYRTVQGTAHTAAATVTVDGVRHYSRSYLPTTGTRYRELGTARRRGPGMHHYKRIDILTVYSNGHDKKSE